MPTRKAKDAAHAETLTARQLNRATLARQLLLARADLPAVAAVEQLIGMQAQEARPPAIGLWSRLREFRQPELHAALHARALVRATLMRGTLHLFSAADYAAFRATIQPVLSRATSLLGERAAGLEPERVLAAARGHLAEQPRTFGELRSLLQEDFPTVNERALGFTVRMQLPLVMAPTTDRWSFPANAAFALAETWLEQPLAAAEDVPDLARRYLAAFGPASVQDFQIWAGLQQAKPVFEALRPELLTFRDERGRELFDLPDAPRPDAETPAPVRFLPEFDNLLLSHADRTRVIADEHRNVVYQKGNLRLLATIMVDGVVSGTWRIERKGKAATLRIAPFAPLPKPVQSALHDEGEALMRFVEADATSYNIVCTT